MGVQVRTATFDGEGKSLPIIQRQFISFKWGDKNIEDFDLIVVFNQRLNKKIYGDFTDTTSNYTYIDGQTHWGTTMQTNTLEFTLATDGMDSKAYEEFKAYFKPGIARKLILSEYPFRYAMARVSTVPTLDMLPFEKEINTQFGTFCTTEYKGEIKLTMVMDDPYWYNTDDSAYFSGKLTEEQLKDNYETGTPCFTRLENMKIDDLSVFPRNYLSSREIDIDGNTIVFDGSTSSNEYVSTVYIGLCDAKSAHYANFSQKIQGQVLPTDLVTVKYVNKSTTSVSTTTMTVLEALEKINSGEISGDISWGTFTERLVLYDKQPDGSINRSKVKTIGHLNSRGDIAASGVMSKAIYIDSEGYATVKDNQTATLDFTYTSGAQDDIDYFEKYSTFGIRLAYSVPSGKTYDYLMILNSIRMTVDLELSNFSNVVYPPDASGWYANGTTIGKDEIVHYYGTAEGRPTLKLEYPIELKATAPFYVSLPYSSYLTEKEDNKINVVSIGENVMSFTLPPLLANYNQALYVIDNLKNGTDIVEAKAQMREQVNQRIVRKWAINALETAVKSEGVVVLNQSIKDKFNNAMKDMIGVNASVILTFDSQQGSVRAQYFNIKQDNDSEDEFKIPESAGSCLKSAMLTIPAKNDINNGIFELQAPNAKDIQLVYNYRFY